MSGSPAAAAEAQAGDTQPPGEATTRQSEEAAGAAVVTKKYTDKTKNVEKGKSLINLTHRLGGRGDRNSGGAEEALICCGNGGGGNSGGMDTERGFGLRVQVQGRGQRRQAWDQKVGRKMRCRSGCSRVPGEEEWGGLCQRTRGRTWRLS